MRLNIICAAFIAALFCGASQADNNAYPVSIQNTHNIDPLMYQEDKMKPLYVEFVESQGLSKAVQKSFEANGYNLVKDATEAQVIYRFDGAFQGFRKITSRLGEIKASDYYEKPKVKTARLKQSWSMLFGLNPTALVGGTVLMNVGTRTSLRDSVNGMFGDPDGICLGECAHMRYVQRGVLRIRRTEDGHESIDAFIADANEKELLASELFEVTESRMRSNTGLPLPIMFKGKAAISVSDIGPVAPSASAPAQ